MSILWPRERGMNQEHSPRLEPRLGLMDATAIGVGAIIGAGIYVVIGIVAGLAGSALIISMIIAAAVALFTALSFSELSAWLPKEGSVYEFSYRLISPLAGFLAGWMYLFGNAFTGAAVSMGFAHYFADLFPAAPPQAAALLLCLAFTALNFFGIRRSAELNRVLVAAKLLILSIFIILGAGYIHPENFRPFVPSVPGVIYGACYIFFAFAGFARVSVMAEEIKDAEHTVPRAIMLSLLISTVFYLLIGAVAIGLVGAGRLAASGSPLAEAISVTGSEGAVYLISLGGLLATSSVLLTTILAVSREAYAMSLRRALPDSLARLHSVYGTPYLSVWITGLLMALVVLFVDLEKVVAISTFGQLFYYALANISDLRLRLQRGQSPALPAAGAASCLALLLFLLFISPYAWALGVILVTLGALYYSFRIKFRIL